MGFRRAMVVNLWHSAIGLGHTLDLILLLDCVAVRRFLGGVHDLISEALRHGLDVTESAVASTGGDERDGLVDTAQWRDIHGLTTHNTSRSDTRGIFPRATVLHGIHVHLEWVLVGEEVDNLESVLDDAHCHHLLTVVAAVHHHGAHQTLHNWAESLAESLGLVTTLSVWEERLCSLVHSNVIHQTQICNVDIVIRPTPEELHFSGRHDGKLKNPAI